MKTVRVGSRFIGEGHPCFVILELGVNFRNMPEAKRLIDKAIEIKADAVKFQTFHAATVAMKGAILKDGRGTVDQYEEFRSSEDRMTERFQSGLIQYARSKGVMAFSTPSHRKDVDLLNKIGGIPAFKFGSDDLTNLPLLKYAAGFKKPVFLSTGVSDLSDIAEAVRTIESAGNESIILLHCVSQYPAEPSDMNLRTMQMLQQAFDYPVGLSDHTEGVAVSIAAAALGAKVIEKHFTLDHNEPGPDNFFSMEPGPMELIIGGVREAEQALGVPFKKVRRSEAPMQVNFHKSIYAVEDIRPGEVISRKNVEILRPQKGIPAKYLDILSGMAVRRKVKKGSALQWEDVKR
ncbi:MAG: N-acetylneuraminate synthase family protein [Candidatus Omnitrophica bacterium]|nr:N-acetylneuraminate synthase family protein [Candidatus Omnitrophota bacterium]